MSERKNIDRLFQEKFKDFEAAPGDHVWKNIEAALQQKKKERKVIPIWWRLSGVAAALVIGLLIINYTFFNADSNGANQVVTNEKNPAKTNRSSKTEGVAEQGKNRVLKPARYVNSPDNPVSNEENSLKSKSAAVAGEGQSVAASPSVRKEKPKTTTDIGIESEKGVAAGGSLPAIRKTNRSGAARVDANAESVVASKSSAVQKRKKNASKININTIEEPAQGIRKTETGLAGRNTKPKKAHPAGQAGARNTTNQGLATSETVESDKNDEFNRRENELKSTRGSGSGIAVNDPSKSQNPVNPQSKDTENRPFGDAKNSVAGDNTLSDNKIKTATLPVADKKLDSAAIATVETNELEKLLAKQNEKEEKVAESKLNRWQVSSSVAPIYFSSSGGSPLDEEFSGNDKSYDNNVSFGVGINYAINDKFSVRTGVNKLTLGYDTNGVIFYAGLDGQSISNISQQGNAAFIEVVDQSKFDGLLPFETSLQDLNYGSISQRMGYIEVPMEMSYKLVDKQFGVTLIGGMSTLFLDENKIRVTSKTMNANLGKANNLNDVHFSSNIGVGFKYNFLKAFEFNFEPMFKYQLNTFSKDSGNFKPYFIGLYSGISFKF
ncbi:hypothetical protein HYN48_03200 [Flavobacterium magnum]|uniref:Outer membrane protein beta-barrel domain-containing protein n=1 Tax=Flavobacterium magnum TaxID=2162713 RepID=A0A2S0RDI8_9FLAO|nr:outer membrane beta-barrel protein [Flavobacterium magnum]AWA29171.1 hypothetical protein HYN48_03200 [Flavobacterium magnum]